MSQLRTGSKSTVEEMLPSVCLRLKTLPSLSHCKTHELNARMIYGRQSTKIARENSPVEADIEINFNYFRFVNRLVVGPFSLFLVFFFFFYSAVVLLSYLRDVAWLPIV